MPALPGSHNTFVKSFDATNKLVVDFARNIERFPVNRYTQIVPVEKVAGYYLEMTIEEAGRLLEVDLKDFVWPDSQPAPEGNDGTESFRFRDYRCTRRAFSVMLGDLAIDQADWPILAAHSSIKARQAMTARTLLAVQALTNAAAYMPGHVLHAQNDVPNAQGNWAASTTARSDIKRGITLGVERILDATLAAIDASDLLLVVSSALARDMAMSQEIIDYIKGSPEALAQIRGELPGRNVLHGLPNRVHGVEVVVEDTRRVVNKKGAARNVVSLFPAGTAVLCARPGSLVGMPDTPSFCSVQLFAQEEMTVETKRDDDNRRTKARVVENLDAKLVAPASTVMFTNAS